MTHGDDYEEGDDQFNYSMGFSLQLFIISSWHLNSSDHHSI